ncbi:hypothetical protein [Thermovenabulum gondwanense]|uniref:4Fe-4S domain-containing protein n=1 Tax=Thermovenabulum gondwanense TaxID=520767 RepID=A0A161QD94_9FIRM|nr:hypothetical protein [Thermovenabulum gondwanense]KYO67803.1 hypothetical protein ATZ99_04430 [Thermovenabulum gondwanense]
MKVFSIRFQNVEKEIEREDFINKIGNELASRGYSVGLLKEDKSLKGQFEKFKMVGYFKDGRVELIFKESNLEDVMNYYNCDYLILENLQGAFPEIVCFNEEIKKVELSSKTIAAVTIKTEKKFMGNIPVLSLEEIRNITDLIVERVFEKLPALFGGGCGKCGEDCNKMAEKIISGKADRNFCKREGEGKIKILVDNKDIPLVPFVEDLFYSVIRSMLLNLKGCKEGQVQIKLKL